MKRKLILSGLCIVTALLLGGCQDYHGLDELTIVAGMAVDVSEEDPELLTVTFEIIDLQSATDSEIPQTILMQTTGRSMGEAVYNASAKLFSNMYFGNCETVIISQDVARDRGLYPIMDSLLRDNEIRDNLHLLVSGEDTASAIVEPPQSSDKIISFNVNLNVDTAEHPANSTRALELYQIYNRLELGSSSIVLPVIGFDEFNEEDLKLNGLALFTGDRMTGWLSEEEVPYYLLGVSRVKGGGYHIALEDGEYASLANRGSKAKQKVSFDGERFHFTIAIDARTEATELSPGWEDAGYDAVRRLEQDASLQLAGLVWQLADRCRREGYDIYELGDCVRNYQPQLWEQVADDWPRWLQDAEIIVECKVKVENTGLIET